MNRVLRLAEADHAHFSLDLTREEAAAALALRGISESSCIAGQALISNDGLSFS